MTKLLTGVITLAALALALPYGVKTLNIVRSAALSKDRQVMKQAASSRQVEKLPDLLKVEDSEKVYPVSRVITLEDKNTVVFRGPVTGDSVGKAMKSLSKMSLRLAKSATIYLVLDTPGGSVSDGADFIDFLQSLLQKVTTVTLFAASMGFQIVENNPGERLIAQNGMLMSHRAAGGLEGQFDGEFESRYRMVKAQIDYLELKDSERMGISLVAYKAKVKDEMWVHGFDAKAEKIADEEVLVQCGESMQDGTDTATFETAFGPVDVTFDKCPLIKQPLEIKVGRISPNARNYVYSAIYKSFNDKEAFIRAYIVNNKINTLFP